MTYSKVLSKYYHKWFRDCHDSAVSCRERGLNETAEQYLGAARAYAEIIATNYDAIEFFSQNDNAHKIDRALPVEFQGYQ